MKKITIKDIADYCNVSATVVSWVINEKFEQISPETVSKVQHAVKKLGYERNEIARSLVTNKSNTIAVIIPDITNPFYAAIVKEVNNIAIKNGFNLLLCDTDNSLELEYKQIKSLDNKLIDGLIIASRNSKKILNKFRNPRSVPIVVIDEQVEMYNDKTTVITTDNVLAAERITNYAIRLGHESIFILGGFSDSTNTRNRYLGVKKSMEKHNIPLEKLKMVYADYKKEIAYIKSLEFLNKQYSCVLAFNDRMAYGAIEALKDMKLNNISIAAFDAKFNLELFKNITNYDLTSINQDEYEIGRRAIKVLINNIKNRGAFDNDSITIPSRIHRGNTLVRRID